MPYTCFRRCINVIGRTLIIYADSVDVILQVEVGVRNRPGIMVIVGPAEHGHRTHI
jgi:hypothetical protein